MTALVALYNSASVHMNDDFVVTLLFSAAGLLFSLALLSVILLSRYQNFHLELAGIAGLIVAIGITADSFVVFFERLRDEVREG